MSTAQGPTSGRAVFKGAFQGTLLYSIPLVGQRITTIFLYAIVTRVLTRSDFGMLSLLEQVNFVLSILLGGNFSSALGYFYFKKELEEKRGKVIGTAIAGAYLLGAMAGVIGWLLMGYIAHGVFRTDEALRYLPIVLLTLPFDFGTEAFFGWLRTEDRQVAYAKICALRIVLTALGIAVLVGVLKMHVLAYLSTTLGTYLIITPILVIYLFRSVRPGIAAELFGPMYRFAMPLGLSFVAMFVVNFGDQFILRHYRSLAEVGIYAMGYKIGMVVAVAYSSFQTYWASQVYAILKRDDADTVFARLFTYAVLLATACTLFVSLAAGPGMRVVVAKDFLAAVPLIPVIAIANGIRVVGEFLRFRFVAAGRPGYRTWCDWIGMAVCLALYFILIPRYGMWGAAAATMGTFIFMAVLSVVTTYRMNPYRVEGARLAKVLGLASVILVLFYVVPVSSLAMQIAWSTLLLALFPAGLWALRFPTPGEWQAVRSIVQRFGVLRSHGAAVA